MRDNDIVERSSCPYTPEQNGCAERKHRHIVETYCALLSYSPKNFTNDFETVVFTFNRLPTQLFNNYFPFNNLLKTYPNYSRLHIFLCVYFPWLYPYSKYKLSRYSKCYFILGYSKIHKVYKCFDPLTSKFCASLHVIFFVKISF